MLNENCGRHFLTRQLQFPVLVGLYLAHTSSFSPVMFYNVDLFPLYQMEQIVTEMVLIWRLTIVCDDHSIWNFKMTAMACFVTVKIRSLLVKTRFIAISFYESVQNVCFIGFSCFVLPYVYVAPFECSCNIVYWPLILVL